MRSYWIAAEHSVPRLQQVTDAEKSKAAKHDKASQLPAPVSGIDDYSGGTDERSKHHEGQADEAGR